MVEKSAQAVSNAGAKWEGGPLRAVLGGAAEAGCSRWKWLAREWGGPTSSVSHLSSQREASSFVVIFQSCAPSHATAPNQRPRSPRIPESPHATSRKESSTVRTRPWIPGGAGALWQALPAPAWFEFVLVWAQRRTAWGFGGGGDLLGELLKLVLFLDRGGLRGQGSHRLSSAPLLIQSVRQGNFRKERMSETGKIRPGEKNPT